MVAPVIARRELCPFFDSVSRARVLRALHGTVPGYGSTWFVGSRHWCRLSKTTLNRKTYQKAVARGGRCHDSRDRVTSPSPRHLRPPFNEPLTSPPSLNTSEGARLDDTMGARSSNALNVVNAALTRVRAAAPKCPGIQPPEVDDGNSLQVLCYTPGRTHCGSKRH